MFKREKGKLRHRQLRNRPWPARPLVGPRVGGTALQHRLREVRLRLHGHAVRDLLPGSHWTSGASAPAECGAPLRPAEGPALPGGVRASAVGHLLRAPEHPLGRHLRAGRGRVRR
eukprot:440885-Alexandrium_andersonii.AAC.1